MRIHDNAGMQIIDLVQQSGGCAKTATLREHGFDDRAIQRAIQSGHLLRPRRGWVCAPDLDPQLVFALRHGVLLSCVSEARRLGLWVSEDHDQPHIAVRSRSQQVSAHVKAHWHRPVVPRRPQATVDALPNVLSLIATCVPFEHAVATWESALNKKLIDLRTLQALPLRPDARHVLTACTPFSDSGLESLFKTRLRWLQVPIRPQIWLHGHRVDFLIGDCLVIQIDGKQHAGAQRLSDLRHDLELRQRGYEVIRLSYTQVMHEWPFVQESLMFAIAAGQHLWRRRA